MKSIIMRLLFCSALVIASVQASASDVQVINPINSDVAVAGVDAQRNTAYTGTLPAVPESDAAIEAYIAEQYPDIPQSRHAGAVEYKPAPLTPVRQSDAVVTIIEPITESLPDMFPIAASSARMVQHQPKRLLISPTTVGASDGYQLGAGDKIKIHVFGEDDLDVEDRLGASGIIRYPFLGKIHVAGMTIPQLERMLVDKLSSRYLINPQVRVAMQEFRPFYLNGEVQKPGAYPYQPDLTVRKAISLGGGFTESADENKVFLILANDSSRRDQLTSLDSIVSPGDIVTIKKSYFFVNGEVVKPGKYPYQSSITYRMAISMAGGMRERADKDAVTVLHEGSGKEDQQIMSIDSLLQPGDVITVKQSFF